jgi:enoyl-CoA hydratase/carnithine racemase
MSLRVVREGAVATIVLDRPEKRNALTLALWRQLADIVRELAEEDEVRVTAIRSSSPLVFASGSDMSEFGEKRSDPETGAIYAAAVLDAERALATSVVPTVAVVQGHCVGGGCKLALACDLRIGDHTATFSIPVARRGVVYPPESLARLLETVGIATARQLLFAGLTIVGDDARSVGLLDVIVAPDELDSAVAALQSQLAAAAPVTIAATKQAINDMVAHRAAGVDRAEFERLADEMYVAREYIATTQNFSVAADEPA